MKLATLILFLLLPIFVVDVRATWNPQEKDKPRVYAPTQQTDAASLEALFKQLDEEDDDITTKISGNRELSGNIKITADSPLPSLPSTESRTKPQKQKVTALDLDLNEQTVPETYINAKIKDTFFKPEPVGSLNNVKVQQLGATKFYEVLEDYTYESGPHKITVPRGFKYDRATVPRVFWILVDKDSLSNVAPLLHDFLYQHGGVLPQNYVAPYRKFSRKDADDLFLEVMTKAGVKLWRRNAAYQAVRKFSGPFWPGN